MHGQSTILPPFEGYQALTEREKQTLRLLLDGYDAKSMARHLDLSVHTINERLREARRKLSVSSSKEAARLLRQAEAAIPQLPGDNPFGDAARAVVTPSLDQALARPPNRWRIYGVIGGLIAMSILIAMLALSTLGDPATQATGAYRAAEQGVADPAVEQAARDWLALVDAGRWAESWAGTSRSFQSLNTTAAWQNTSERARVPLGPVVKRTLIDQRDVPAPPNGYRMVRFRTDFASKAGAIETLSLDREGDQWKVAGVYIE